MFRPIFRQSLTIKSYTLIGGTTLTVAAPGVLTNDTDSDSQPLTAILASRADKRHGEPDKQRQLRLYAEQ